MNRTTLLSASLLTILLFNTSPLFAMGTPKDQSEDIFDLGEVSVAATSMTPIDYRGR